MTLSKGSILLALILWSPIRVMAASLAIPASSTASAAPIADIPAENPAELPLFSAGPPGARTTRSAVREPVLVAICYHRFGIETRLDPYCISPFRLAAELRWLRSDGWASVSLTQVAAALDGDTHALPRKGIVLSVDDGYKAGALGAPVFRRYGFHAVYFVVPGILGHSAFLSYRDLRRLEAQGHEVACHTLTHADLAKVPPGMDPLAYARWVDHELRESKRLLEKALGHPVDALAWPYGAYNPAVAASALRVGYRQLWSVSGGVNAVQDLDRTRLRRIILMGLPSLKSFQQRVEGLPLGGPVDCISEGDLFYRSQLPVRLSVPIGVRAALGGVSDSVGTTGGLTLDTGLSDGFHYLNLADWHARRSTSFLFQVAPDAWRPYFAALAAGVSSTGRP